LAVILTMSVTTMTTAHNGSSALYMGAYWQCNVAFRQRCHSAPLGSCWNHVPSSLKFAFWIMFPLSCYFRSAGHGGSGSLLA